MDEETTTSHILIQPNNIVIICLGFALLIVPVVFAMVWVCFHKRVFQHVKIVATKSNGTSQETVIPYSNFTSSDCEDKPTLAITVPSEVRVLVYRETTKNTAPKNQNGLSHSSNSAKKKAQSNAFVLTDDVYCDSPTFKLPYAPPLTDEKYDLKI